MPPATSDQLLRLLVENAYLVYDSCMVGNPAPKIAERYEAIANPKPGDLVLEVTAGIPRSSGVWDREAIGYLEKVTTERIDALADEKWDEAAEGRPCPTEDCWYVRSLATNTPTRWVNCRFIKVYERRPRPTFGADPPKPEEP